MNKTREARRSKEHLTGAQRLAGGVGAALLLLVTGVAGAQTASVPQGQQAVVQDGYVLHETADLGGHFVAKNGSGDMYDTLVNIQSGPRVLGETFTLHALPGSKHPLLDDLSAFSNGFGGDPNNFASLNFSKGKLYEFNGLFRRDRTYFDYDLLGNPQIPTGQAGVPIGAATAPTGYLRWPEVTYQDSPFLYNTVRRMLDTDLTLFPLSKVTIRVAYAQNIFQGPSLTPSGNSVAGQEVILEEYQRNSTDDFTGAIDWKPVPGTKLTFEEQVDHYKADSYFTMDPALYTVQEGNGEKVALLDSYTTAYPYGYNSAGSFAPGANCNSSSLQNSGQILSANPGGGLPIIDPACNVISSYYRSQPWRVILPTEIFRLQSTSIKNIQMNGDLRYTNANMNMPNYWEEFQGLDGNETEIRYQGHAGGKREVIAADYGITWDATRTISLSDQITFSDAHQPGAAALTSGTLVKTPTTAGEETINQIAGLTTSAATGTAFEGGPTIGGAPLPAYFGQRFLTNNATVRWDATPRASFALTYRYSNHVIMQNEGGGNPGNVPLGPITATSDPTTGGTVTINENGGIFNASLRPSSKMNINGTAEVFYYDNVYTPVMPRQEQHYRVHFLYRPKEWASVTAAYNDMELHNNTNNTGISTAGASTANPVEVGGVYVTMPIVLEHEAHTRIASLGMDLTPSPYYGFDFSYAFNDVYVSTNACGEGAAGHLPGGSVLPAIADATGSLCSPISKGFGSDNILVPYKDFESAPTEYGSASLALNPTPKVNTNLGYRFSDSSGSRAFSDTGDVNGALDSLYQTPFVNVAWTVHPGLIWKGEYDFYGYGESDAQSGAQYCNTNTAPVLGATSETSVPCSTIANSAMSPGAPAYGFLAPRNFHTNILTLSLHYEF